MINIPPFWTEMMFWESFPLHHKNKGEFFYHKILLKMALTIVRKCSHFLIFQIASSQCTSKNGMPFFRKNPGKTRQGRKAGGLQAWLHMVKWCSPRPHWFFYKYFHCVYHPLPEPNLRVRKRDWFLFSISWEILISQTENDIPRKTGGGEGMLKKKCKYFTVIFAFLKLIQLWKGMSGKQMKNSQQIKKITKVTCGRGIGSKMIILSILPILFAKCCPSGSLGYTALYSPYSLNCGIPLFPKCHIEYSTNHLNIKINNQIIIPFGGFWWLLQRWALKWNYSFWLQKLPIFGRN